MDNINMCPLMSSHFSRFSRHKSQIFDDKLIKTQKFEPEILPLSGVKFYFLKEENWCKAEAVKNCSYR